MTSASPSPKSPELSEKSKKYDRQLRLWGDHGQSRLEASRICLINANATGTEILKSLVLPGCGAFTIVDSKTVSHEDIGNNFFLDLDCLGKNRGESTRQFLLELNTDVSGESVDNSPENILAQDPNFFSNFTAVIGSQLSEKTLILMSKTLHKDNVPFIYCHCIGLVGWIRVQLNEHTVVESHPDSIIDDLRLDIPFPELVDHMKSINLTVREEVVKTPWLVILYKGLEAYMEDGEGGSGAQTNDGGNLVMDTLEKKHPSRMNSSQKQEFKQFLKRYLYSLGLNEGDEAYDETLRAINTALHKTAVPMTVQNILEDPKVTAAPESSKFWTMCYGLKEFVGVNGQLPVRGTLPDMTADSQKYISLQNVFREKASKDVDDVYGYCQEVIQRSGPNNRVTIRQEDVRLFCKEAYNLCLIRGRPIHAELESSPAAILHELSQNSEDCEEDKMYYLILRGTLRFYSEYNTFPGALDDYEPDIIRFKQLTAKLLNEWNSSLTIKEEFIHEICRSGAAEVPSVAAFIGGCAAQEVIKIVTSQYIPLNNTLIYNAINSTTTSFSV